MDIFNNCKYEKGTVWPCFYRVNNAMYEIITVQKINKNHAVLLACTDEEIDKPYFVASCHCDTKEVYRINFYSDFDNAYDDFEERYELIKRILTDFNWMEN